MILLIYCFGGSSSRATDLSRVTCINNNSSSRVTPRVPPVSPYYREHSVGCENWSLRREEGNN